MAIRQPPPADQIRTRKQLRKLIKEWTLIVPRTEMAGIWRDKGSNFGWQMPVPQFVDREYKALPYQLWAAMFRMDNFDKMAYRSEYRDCDDFAAVAYAHTRRRYMVNGVGMVRDYVGKHMYNCRLDIMYDANGPASARINYFEPQSDKVLVKNDICSRKEYDLTKGSVWW